MKPRTKKLCDKCNKEISVSNFNKHYKTCGTKSNTTLYLQKNGKHKCPKCEKEFDTSQGVKFHIWSIHTENRIWDTCKGRTSPLKGRKNGPRPKEVRDKISKNNKGGRCKWFEITKPSGEIIKVQGTYEKRFAIILNILDENWIKLGIGDVNHTFEWIDNDGKSHNYTPDFYSPRLNKYYETKGYWWNQDKLKMKYILSHYNNIEMIFKNDLEKYEKIYGELVS